MSSAKLLNSAAGRYGKPLFPPALEKFQRLYETRRHRNHPVTAERLQQFAADLKMIALPGSVKFKPDFVTKDEESGQETHWRAVSLRYISGNKYVIAFPQDEDPKHHDGTVSAHHVALYSLDDELNVRELDNVAQAAYAIYSMAH